MEKGLRFNEGKIRYTLLDNFALRQMTEVFEYGAKKYGEGNWQKGMSWKTVIQSLERHLASLKEGIDIDEETGKLHAAHIACNAHILTSFYKIYPQGDDRISYNFKTPKIALDIDGVIADFVGHIYSYLKLPNHPATHWNDYRILNNFHLIKDDELFWQTIPVMEIPLFEPTAYVTARPNTVEQVESWLTFYNFPKAPIHIVSQPKDKLQVLLDLQIDYFVEDNYETFCLLNNSGIKTFLKTQSYNEQYNVKNMRVSSLKDLFNRFFNNL